MAKASKLFNIEKYTDLANPYTNIAEYLTDLYVSYIIKISWTSLTEDSPSLMLSNFFSNRHIQ